MQQWPPQTVDEMKALQKEYGADTAIAHATGCSREAVKKRRLQLGVPRWKGRRPTANDLEPIGPTDPMKGARPKLTEGEVAKLYAGRRYEDVRLVA